MLAVIDDDPNHNNLIIVENVQNTIVYDTIHKIAEKLKRHTYEEKMKTRYDSISTSKPS